MAKIELSQEVREIESLIDAGDEHAATLRLRVAQGRLGRRPEWRYLRCLFDASFRTRADRDILKDAIELVGEQPDLMEASALLGELYARTGNRSRAELFAREALAAPSEKARWRASRVLGVETAAPASVPPLPVIPSLAPSVPRSAPPITGPQSAPPTTAPQSAPPTTAPQSAPPTTAPQSAPPGAGITHSEVFAPRPGSIPPNTFVMPPLGEEASYARRSSAPPPAAGALAFGPPASLTGPPMPPPPAGDWFEQARAERVHRRTPLHGVKQVASTVDALMELARAVAEGRSPLSARPLPLDRDGLAEVDAALLQWRKQRLSQGRKTEHGEPMAAAAFLLAVALHEIPHAYALDTLPDDGGCKVALPSGLGARPILVASAYATGTGVSLLETFDRLAHAAKSAPPGPPRRSSTGSMPAYRSTSSMFPVAPESSPPSTASPASPSGSMAALDARRSSFPVLATPVPPPVRISSRPPGPMLTVTRTEAEAAPARRIDAPDGDASPPPMDLVAEAAAFARSPLGQEIASRSGAGLLATSPAGVEALESYCVATRGENGVARARTWMPTPDEEREIVQWGAFLGETLIALYGGRWEADPFAPGDARLFRVVCGGRVATWPVTQVYLRWKNGAAHDLISYLAAVGHLLRG